MTSFTDLPVEPHEPAPAVIAQLRRLTGLTWEQLAYLFDVNRQSVHFWASGGTMTAAHRIHLERVLDTVRFVDHGSITENRAALLETRHDGTTLLDQLAVGNYDVVTTALGRGRQRAVVTAVVALSPDAKAARMPRPPKELVDASREPIHEDFGSATATSVNPANGSRESLMVRRAHRERVAPETGHRDLPPNSAKVPPARPDRSTSRRSSMVHISAHACPRDPCL